MGFFQIGAFIVALLAIVGAAARIQMFNLERKRLAMERRRVALYEADLRRRGVYTSDDLRERIRREWEEHGG
jgi:hypothetical protein